MRRPNSYLDLPETIRLRARFPVVDAHNHLWSVQAAQEIDAIAAVLDEVGVVGFCDLTGNANVSFEAGGCALREREFAFFANELQPRGAGRFYAFTMAGFARPTDRPLFEHAEAFVRKCIEVLRDHVRRGARGLKVLKELGLAHHDAAGTLIRVDDERLAPIWRACADLGVPVMIHQADPDGFFDPVTPQNEHYDSLRKFPAWSYASATYPRKSELLANRDRLIAAHPDTVFILPHVANHAENLASVAALLERFPNVMIDISARCDELGRQPYTARRFLVQYADRILFGTDMPADASVYRFHFRFLETDDEYIVPPDYDGTFGRHRWKVHGLHLPDAILRKLYYENACRVIPGLAEQLAGMLPGRA
jgi:predicted TIM-barrel fold metal-dependent hydrolase